MLPNLRRLIPAAAVAFVGFGVIGVAAAEGEVPTAGPEPTWFQLAPRHAGDRAMLRLTVDTVFDGWPYSAEVVQHWTWLEEQAWVDGNGTWHAVHPRLLVQETSDSFPVEATFYHETATGGLLGLGFGSMHNSSAQWAGVPVLPTSFAWSSQVDAVHWLRRDACGLDLAVRAGLPLTATAVVEDHCIPGPQPVEFSVGNGKVGDVETVRFATTRGQTTFAHHYNAGIPEPLLVERSTENDGYVHRDATELSGFEAGTGVWDSGIGQALPQPLALPAIEVVPRDPWGPSEAGIEHPFPASAAWAFAAGPDGAEEFADFLALHPTAAASQAQYQEHMQGSEVDRSWMFTVESGNGAVTGVVVTQSTAPPGSEATDLLGVDPVPVEGEPQLSAESRPAMACPEATIPSTLPTVVSALARWQAFTDAQTPGNAWGLDCDGIVLAGSTMSRGEPIRAGTDASLQQSGNASESYLLFGQDGRAWGQRQASSDVRLDAQVSSPTAAPPPAGGSADEVGEVRPSLAVAGFAWRAPAAPVASGAAAVSVLAGLLYWLWPTLKGGAFSLFSRIETPRLLEHPTRRAIADAVEAEPGIHYQAIVRIVGGGKGAVDHHLRKLVAAGLLLRHQGPGFTCYFPPKVDRRVTAAAGFLKSEGARRVLAAVQAHPGATSVQLAAATGLDASTVSHHVHRLAAAGVLQATKVGRTLVVQPTFLAGQVTAAGAA